MATARRGLQQAISTAGGVARAADIVEQAINTGLVVGDRDRHHRHTAAERLEHGVEAGMGDGEGSRVIKPAGVHRRHGGVGIEQQGAAEAHKRQIEHMGHGAPPPKEV
jgi:hypothetical protein